MKQSIILTLLFFVQICFCQSNIKLNQKAPEISITDWVLNVPKDKNLNNKFIVLEFWATWCGPCIKAVPHLNEIQEKTKRKDLYFISITDESVEKINRIAKRIQFNSIVVSDQSKKTQINFGNGVTGLEVYPFTVLIDNKGIIKWIGMPESLTEEIVNDFLNATLKPDNAFDKKSKIQVDEKTSISENVPDYFEDFLKLVKNKNIIYKFDIVKTDSDNATNSKFSENIFFYNSLTIKDMFSEILNYTPSLIDIDETLNKQKYSVNYKNNGKYDRVLLENEFLNFLKIKKSILNKKLIINQVFIKNNLLLEETLDEGMSSISDADKNKLITGLSITSLMTELNKNSSDIYEFNNLENIKFYDFIINITSKQTILNSLNSYGLDVKIVYEEREIVKIEAME